MNDIRFTTPPPPPRSAEPVVGPGPATGVGPGPAAVGPDEALVTVGPRLGKQDHIERLAQLAGQDFGDLPFEVGPPVTGGILRGNAAEMPPITEQGKAAFEQAAQNTEPGSALVLPAVETPPMTDGQQARAAAVRAKLPNDESKAAFDKLAANGTLTRADANGESNVLDHLERLAGSRQQGAGQMLGELAQQLANPAMIGQMTPNSCLAAHSQQEIAAYEPGEYARTVADLVVTGSTTTMAGHEMKAYSLEPLDGATQTWAERGGLSGMFQASFMDYACQFTAGESHFNHNESQRYNLDTDQTVVMTSNGEWESINQRQGLNTKRGLDALASLFVKHVPKDLQWYNDVSEWRRIAEGVLASGKTPGCIINTGPGMQHMIRVTAISDDAISFVDPTRPGERQTMPMAEFIQAFQPDPTKDVNDNTGNSASMSATSGSARGGGGRRR